MSKRYSKSAGLRFRKSCRYIYNTIFQHELTIDSNRLTLESYTSVLMGGHPPKSSHSLVQLSTGLLMATCSQLYLISSSQSQNIHDLPFQLMFTYTGHPRLTPVHILLIECWNAYMNMVFMERSVLYSTILRTPCLLTSNFRFSPWLLIMHPTTTHLWMNFLNYLRVSRVL